MRINSDNIRFLCGNPEQIEKMCSLKRLVPFSDTVCDFLMELSSLIMKNPRAKAFSDVITFGFFCRKANISKLKSEHTNRLYNRLGRGVSFHIAPSNVPINFAYSLVSALLAGNSCIVRVSSKNFEQVNITCECMNELFKTEKFSEMFDYIAIVQYPKSKEINDYFSSISDLRIIWGGNTTISELRQSPIPPRTTDITFADRYSIAVIDAKSVIEANNLLRLAEDFFNDTYLYDQNACSSPRLVYWLGSKEEYMTASEKFWKAVHNYITPKYKIEPIIAVDKYTASCRMAIDMNADITSEKDNLISRIRVNDLNENLPDYRCAGGSFIEYHGKNLNALGEIVTEKYQTLSYYGIDKEKLADFVVSGGLSGIDRIVPIGKTADFELVWDGYDLIIQMSRAVSF